MDLYVIKKRNVYYEGSSYATGIGERHHHRGSVIFIS
jgi:hypothetical protein